MKNSSPNQELFEYYDERAPEYEGIYSGGIPASVSAPDAYKEEVNIIAKLLSSLIGGKCIDIACGTGFWLPFYEKNCSEITLIDQSARMLAECTQKIRTLGIESKTEIIRDDFFNHPFPQNKYDSALIGFLLSHLTEAEEQDFFHVLKRILKPEGRFVIIDGVWSKERAATRSRVSLQKRTLADGREFTIFKRYFIKKDFNNLARKYKMNVDIIQWGRVFAVAAGNFAGS